MSLLKRKGTLIPIGGNENRGEDVRKGLDFINDGILSRIVKEAGGIHSLIVIIPTASSIPEEVGDNYMEAFEKLGCTNVIVLNIQDRVKAELASTLDLISKANCVLFSGGDQSKIVDFIGQTSLHHLLSERYINDDFVIAGTSAGAMAMSVEMISGGSSKVALLKGAIKMKKGMGFIPELIIDTHFITRGRFGRVAEAVAIHPDLMGVGLAEDTGLVIKGGKEFTVIGSGMVILFDASHLTHNNHSIMKKNTPISMSNLITHILAKGDRFVMEDRILHIKPLSEENYI